MSKLQKKKMLFSEPNYVDPDTCRYRINADYLKHNSSFWQECDREVLVSLFQLQPLIEKTVPLEEADYILYSHPYARCNDMSGVVIKQLREIDARRKPGAEIIVVNKSCNVKEQLVPPIKNITYYFDHYAEKLGKRFGMPEITEQYFVYDSEAEEMDIWPVDGCMRKCKFCRRSYIHIPFESLPLERIESQLEWYASNDPEKIRHIQLRAENLTEYGIDLYGEQKLAELIEMISSFDEVQDISTVIGLTACEVTDKILEAICRSGKFYFIRMNPEAGTNRLLRHIGKDCTVERMLYIARRLREAYPELFLAGCIMIGLPTETLEDVYGAAELIVRMGYNYVHVNNYGHAERNGMGDEPQLSNSLQNYHLNLFLSLLKKYKNEFGDNDVVKVEYDGTCRHRKTKSGMFFEAESKRLLEEYQLSTRRYQSMVYVPHYKRFCSTTNLEILDKYWYYFR